MSGWVWLQSGRVWSLAALSLAVRPSQSRTPPWSESSCRCCQTSANLRKIQFGTLTIVCVCLSGSHSPELSQMCAPISGIMLVFFLFTGTYNNTQWNLSNQDTNWAEGSVLLVRWPLSGIYLGQERVHVIKVFHCIYTAVKNALCIPLPTLLHSPA